MSKLINPTYQTIPSVITWNTTSASSINLVPFNGYILHITSNPTLLLPATPAIGDTYYIMLLSAGGFTVTSNYIPPATLYCGDTTLIVGSTLSTIATAASLTIVCKTLAPGPTFQVLNLTGAFTMSP
jgi:hypothetical protein